MKRRFTSIFAIISVFSLFMTINVMGQSANCNTASILPTGMFVLPAAPMPPGLPQVFYVKATIYVADPFTFRINATTNSTINWGAAAACTPLASGAGLTNSDLTTPIPDGYTFPNTGCQEIFIAISNPGATPVTITAISIDPSEPTNYVCPIPGNINIDLTAQGTPYEMCDNAGLQNIVVTATDNSGNAICLAEGTLSGPGITDGVNNTGTFDPAAANVGANTITYTYQCPGGPLVTTNVNVEVFKTPLAILMDVLMECRPPTGSIYLPLMNNGGATAGTWTYENGPAGASSIVDDENYNYDRPGCYEFRFTVTDDKLCNVPPSTATAFVFISTRPEFDFSLSTQGGCLATGSESVDATITTTEVGLTTSWTVNGNIETLPFNVTPPGVGQTSDFEFCYTMTRNTAGTICGDSTAKENCSEVKCQRISFFNDGLDCQSNCPMSQFQVCDIEVEPRLNISCNFFTIAIPFEVVGADISPNSKIVGCSDTEVCIDYNSDAFMIDVGAGPGGTKIKDLPGISVICDVFNFCVCIDVALFEIEFRPFGALYDLFGCDETLAQIIFRALGTLLGGDGGGAMVVADTDGDGSFDYIVEDSPFPISKDNVCVPIQVDKQGTVTIRMVSGWPLAPAGVCGDATPQGMDLLEIIPIGSIPIVGPTIEGILELAGCGSNLAWTNEETVEYVVINDEDPVFANCPPTGYTFSEDFACNTTVNWSIPVAIDGCSGEILPFTTIAGTDPGVRHVSGPMPGADLDVGTYTVVYEAIACNGLTSQCSFPVVVTTGTPQLEAPANVVVGTDVDQCTAVVLGLTPLKGIGCSTTITYSTTGVTPLSGTGDISGSTFNLGVTTVTYTMSYDHDGDPNTPPVVETDMFTVTVEDDQNPVADCRDLQFTLDNMGMVTIDAEEFDGASSDNCTANAALIFTVSKDGTVFSASLDFDCAEKGLKQVTLRVEDEAGNVSFCLATVDILDFFNDYQLTLDAPELCLEANNPEQLDFTNYLNITRPNGQIINHSDVGTLGGNVGGFFGITSFIPSTANTGVEIGTGPNDPRDIGYINPFTGVYTPGSGSGFVTISYLLTIGGQISQDNFILTGCYLVVHETFELRPSLEMGMPSCECFDLEARRVDLGIISGGLEPYRITYTGATLDLNRNGFPDDTDGIFTYDANAGYNIADATEDLGQLLVDFTIPVWSISIIDARGCEIARSGSCDNDDLTEAPGIVCPANVDSLFTETYVCENQYSWVHPLPFDNCKVIIYDYQIVNPDGTIEGPFDLVNLLNISPGAPLDARFDAEYEFTKGVSTVMYYVEDAVGLFDTCSFTVTVIDDDPPIWQNCPRLPIVENAETGHCDAYVNFSAPYAIDNCADTVIYRQIDETGLNSGSRFPVGTTILIFEAEDECGNIDTCEYKIIVNDFWEKPIVSCVDSIYQINDLDECGAVVLGLSPTVMDTCAAGITVTYVIEDENGDTISVGSGDASGEFFPVGLNEVIYCVTDQPALLITEVTQQISDDPVAKLIGPTNPLPTYIIPDSTQGDYIEISNMGPAAMDISCLQIAVCVDTGTLCTYIVPNLTVIPVGEVLTLRVGSGMDDTTNLFFNMGCVEADITEPRGYVISLYDRVLDVVTTNGFDPVGCGSIAIVTADDWSGASAPHYCSGSYYRETLIDHNDPRDWIKATSCDPATIGFMNPTLAPDVNIWNGDTVSLQSVAPGKVTCTTKVFVEDVEIPNCVEYDTIVYSPGTNLNTTIACGDCFESVINVPTDLLIGDINVLNLMGTSTDINNLDVSLIGPNGTEIRLFNNMCNPGDADFNLNLDDDWPSVNGATCNPLGGGGTYAPQEELKEFYLENMMGDWTLQIANNSCADESAVLLGWELQIMGILPYSQGDTTLSNEVDECSAEFCWIHPILEDNCCVGTIDVEYIPMSSPNLIVPTGGRIVQGTSVCETFHVGRTKVKYTLTDQYGNPNMCMFEVTVQDTQRPMILDCPVDVDYQLSCGECGVYWYKTYRATDNCFVDTIIVSPPNGSWLPIGDTVICVIAIDSSGNADTCKYEVRVIEYTPINNSLACIDDINLSLDASCTAKLNADMILEGCNHGCYESYIIEVTEGCHGKTGGRPGPVHADSFDLADVGKCFTVTVTDPRTGNSCWGCVCIEDKTAPEIQCPADDTVSCLSPLHPDYTGYAELLTCEVSATITYKDSVIAQVDCTEFESILYRRWTVTDATGKKATCLQSIHIEAFDLDDVVFPRHYDNLDLPALECNEQFDPSKDVSSHIIDFPYCVDGYLLDSARWFATGGDLSLPAGPARDLSGDRHPMVLGWNTLSTGPFEGHPSPDPLYYDEHPQFRLFGACWGPDSEVKWQGTGTPTLGGVSLYDNDRGYCELSIRYDDEVYDICEDGYEILRYWKVRDMCKTPVFGINPKIYIQVIKVLDKTGPEIIYPDAVTVGTDVWNCYSRWDVPEPWLKDNCSSDLSYTVRVWDGRAIQRADGSWVVEGLPLGVHKVVIEATDGCNNVSLHEVEVTVIDDTPPICVSKDRLQLSLSGSQSPGTNYSAICAEDLNKASYDNCTQWLWYKMIRVDELLGTANGSFADNDVACGGIDGDDDALQPGNQVYFDDCAKFCCDDADQIILVVLRVHDVDPGAGPVSPIAYTPPAGSLVGHFTDCWVEIDVRDKAQPIVVAPPDMVVSCMFWFDDSDDALTDPDNPTFGRVVTDLADREKVKTIDIVCEAWCEDHPKYDYEPSRNRPVIASTACDFYNDLYDAAHPDDKYELVWGYDGYAIRTCGTTPTIRANDQRECGQGLITRDVTVTYVSPHGGATTYRDRQEIWVIDCDPFYVNNDNCFDDEDCIQWPIFCQQPQPIEGCGAEIDPYANPQLGYPVIENGCDDNCALVAVEYEDELFTIQDTACFKVIRTWTVIDWCTYDPFDFDPDEPVGRWEWVQVIIVRDQVDAIVEVTEGDCEPLTYVNDPVLGCIGHVDLCATAMDDCSPEDALVYDYKIDAYSDGVGAYGDFDLYAGKLTQQQVSNGIFLNCESQLAYDQACYYNPFADDPTQPFCASGTYPIGVHTIYWFVEDGCGNVVKEAYEFEIKDCKEPTPYCKTGIITVVMPANGEICVWAKDLNDGSSDNCTDTTNLKFYFDGNTADSVLCWDCDDFEAAGGLDKLLVEVEVWVEDEAGNSDFCKTSIEIQDNMDVCNGTGSISFNGGVENAIMAEGVQNVEVYLNGIVEDKTDNAGGFAFGPLVLVNDYLIRPAKNDDPLNGVNTSDLVAIQRHLLGKLEFTTAYQYIAADVNNTESVSAGDIASLRKLILGTVADFSANSFHGQKSWRFVDRGYVFTDFENPWGWPEEVESKEGNHIVGEVNFHAVKIGDITGDAKNNGLTGSGTRGNGTLTLVTSDAILSAGDQHRMEITADNFTAIAGFQFTMQYDDASVEFAGLESGALTVSDENIGVSRMSEGLVTMSWHTLDSETFGSDEVLFTIVLEVFNSLQLSEAINVNSTITAAEAYEVDLSAKGLELNFRDGGAIANVFELYQNIPNPFKSGTVIGFNLPQSMPAVLTVYDVAGKVLLVSEIEGKKGYNETTITNTQLNGTGILYYQLDAANNTATKQMILLD